MGRDFGSRDFVKFEEPLSFLSLPFQLYMNLRMEDGWMSPHAFCPSLWQVRAKKRKAAKEHDKLIIAELLCTVEKLSAEVEEWRQWWSKEQRTNDVVEPTS